MSIASFAELHAALCPPHMQISAMHTADDSRGPLKFQVG